jgi:hypothetical protein
MLRKMAYLARSGFGLLALAHVHTGCDELIDSKACGDVGCFGETAVVIDRPDAVWADGDYTFDIRLGGEQHRCAFTLPIPGKLPHELQLRGEPVECTPALPGANYPAVVALHPTPDFSGVCPRPDGGPPLASCPPLDGRYHIEIHTTATPEELELRLAFGDAVLFEQTTNVEYVTLSPNGPGCAPVCYSAQLGYEIAEPP